MKKLLIALLFMGSSIANAGDNVDISALAKTLSIGSKVNDIAHNIEIKKVITAPMTSSCEKTLTARGYSKQLYYYGKGFEGVLYYAKFSESDAVTLYQFQKEMSMFDIKPIIDIQKYFTPVYIKGDNVIVCAWPSPIMYRNDMAVNAYQEKYIMYVMSKSDVDNAVLEILKSRQSSDLEKETQRSTSFDAMNSELDSLN